MLRKLICALCSVLTLSAGNPWDQPGRQWWKHIVYLAGDNLQGRNVGTPGFDLAADYVAQHYEQSGLQTTCGESYFQTVQFLESTLKWASIRIARHGKIDPVAIPSEALVHFSANYTPEVSANVVFAGYGLKIPELDYDDFVGLPVKGAIVAYLSGGPADVPVALKAHYSSTDIRWQAMHAAGAVGMIALPNPKYMEVPWIRQAATVSSSRMTLADSAIDRWKGLEFSATWNPVFADHLLVGSGHTFSEILEADARKVTLPHFSLGSNFRASMTVSSQLVSSKNVIAVHPGSDDVLKDEYIVVSAHLDHLGIEKTAHGNTIFRGAMDDASGISSVIEIAEMLRDVPTKRSILFLAFTGEEKGELGSEYFNQHPTVKGRIVADLNMDMFLPLVPLKWLEVQGLNESTLGGDIKAVAEGAGVKVQADKEPGQNRFIRSDQYSFVKAGIPALAFKFGYQKGEPEEKIFERWYSDRYHSVKDDLNQPVDLEGAARFNDILRCLLVRVADANEAPKWSQNSLFARFAIAPGI